MQKYEVEFKVKGTRGKIDAQANGAIYAHNFMNVRYPNPIIMIPNQRETK